MKFPKSDLEMLDFIILESHFKYLEPKEKLIDPNVLFNKYDFDIDFIARESDDLEYVFIKIQINDLKKPVEGYIMFVEAVCTFKFNTTSKMTEKDKSKYLYGSGLSIAINNLRSYISNISSNYPLGRFTLPLVDVGELHNLKKSLMDKKEQDKKGRKKNKEKS